MKKLMIMILLATPPQLTMATTLINDMQSCQGLLEFVDAKLESTPRYNEEDVTKIRKGIETYNLYIQREIIAPELLKAASGDKTKADNFQRKVDHYKQTLVEKLEAKDPKNILLVDHAIAINDCANKAVPSGKALDELKDALNIMVKLAKSG